MPTNNTGELARAVQDLQQDMAEVKSRQVSFETSFTQFRRDNETEHKGIREESVTKNELSLKLENIRLTIDVLSTKVQGVDTRLGGMENSIVKKVSDIADKQQEGQTASLRRIIGVQAAILICIMAAVLGVVIPLLLQHH